MGKLVDLSNKKFGKLLIISRFGLTKHGEYAKWYCRCDCGNYCIKTWSSIKKSSNPSCGCEKKNNLGNSKRKDLSNKRFGKLTVISYSHSYNNRAVWKCKCDCGNECLAIGKYLLDGSKKSCGCAVHQIVSSLKKKPLQTGSRFGNLTVLNQEKNRKGKQIYYLCKCDCGNVVSVSRGHLVRGQTRSCGCIKSFPELYISQFFTKKNILFEHNYKQHNCLSLKNRILPFDFAVFDNQHNLMCLLQFQGIQHFKNSFGSNENDWKQYINHDKIKENYCQINKIPFFLISYKDDLEQKLNTMLKEIGL